MEPIDVARECARRTSGVILPGDLLANGMRPADIRSLLRSRLLAHIDVGVYALADSVPYFQDIYRYRVIGYLMTRHEKSPGVLTGLSALVVRGMPVWVPVGEVCIGRDHSHGPKKGRAKNLGRIPKGQIVTMSHGATGQFTAATTARSICDAARSGPVVNAIAAGDAALRAGLTAPDAIDRSLQTMRGMKNVAAARFAASLLDGASETPGESSSRLSMHRLGVPAPLLQQEIYDRDGLIGRVDFLWSEFGIVGEYDGRFTCGRASPSRRPAPDVLFDEKRREGRLRAAGYVVVRWTAEDLRHPERFRRIIIGAFQHSIRLAGTARSRRQATNGLSRRAATICHRSATAATPSPITSVADPGMIASNAPAPITIRQSHDIGRIM